MTTTNKKPLKITEENYFSKEAEKEYMSSSQYRAFVGTLGIPGCEARIMAEMNGTWKDEEEKEHFLIGNYLDAHFAGCLDVFIAQHSSSIFKPRGGKYAPFIKADEMIARIEKDEYFVKTMSGGIQEIFTGEFFGCQWKSKLDSYHKGRAIVDLKTTKSIRGTTWVKDYGQASFVEFYDYTAQLAIYQKTVEMKTGDRLPVLIAAVSKEKNIDIEVISIDQKTLDNKINEIEGNMPRVLRVKSGYESPDRCGCCKYCIETKKLTGPIHVSEIGGKIK